MDTEITRPGQKVLLSHAAEPDAEPHKRIFIVEDETILADNLEDLLISMGYDVPGKVSTGEEAVESILELKPDLVLMDVSLRGKMDGIEAAHMISGQQETALIFLTANSDLTIRKRILGVHSFGFVLKPFDERELQMAIEIALYRCAAEARLKNLNHKLHSALAQIKTLSGLLPICSWCKKVRNDTGYWQQLETYLTQHSDAQLTHGICPDCAAEAAHLPP